MIWTTPWPIRKGDFFFFENTYQKHPLVRVKLLANAGHNVVVAVPDSFSRGSQQSHTNIQFIELSATEAVSMLGTTADPSPRLYVNSADEDLTGKIANWLGPKTAIGYRRYSAL